jgi:hypothetical protein
MDEKFRINPLTTNNNNNINIIFSNLFLINNKKIIKWLEKYP